MVRGDFTIEGGPGFCNAIRRSLLSDVTSWAPKHVVIRKNTSCQTDEFLAHRIGMIPFRRLTDAGDGTVTLSARGPGVACAREMSGVGFAPVHGDIEVMRLGDDHELDLTVHFDEKPASAHARYMTCAAAGMCPVDAGATRHRIHFDTLDDAPPREVMLRALDAFEARVDAALLALAHPPEQPPASMT